MLLIIGLCRILEEFDAEFFFDSVSDSSLPIENTTVDIFMNYLATTEFK